MTPLYQPLDVGQRTIRLLSLNPALLEEDPIECGFVIASLNDEPEYEALSYVWGSIEDTPTIGVGGASVSITRNLESALRRLRRKDEERIMWIDALCINQVDTKERMHQVSQMASIYHQATRVVVWLGEGWDGSNMAMELLRKLGDDANLHLDPSLAPCVSVDGMRLDSPVLCRNVIRLFDLPWWKRAWTVQEFVLAKDLVFQCSTSQVTGTQMYMARENFWGHGDRCCPEHKLDYRDSSLGLGLFQSFVQPANLDIITKTRGPSYSFLETIARFSLRQVTDPRDHIYGMLGLGTDEYAYLVEPDYTRSAEEVCSALAFRSVEPTGTLEFLSHVFGHHNPRLPSFILNWTGEFGWEEIYQSRLHNINLFSASIDLAADLDIISDAMVATPGLVFDVVVATGSNPFGRQVSQTQSFGEFFEELHRLANVEESTEELYAQTGDLSLVAL